MGISHVVENFRRSVSTMTNDGDTALWDALALGMDQVNEYGRRYPQAKKRIICISDGLDNNSMSNTAADVCWRLHQANIVVDSVMLGSNGNGDLRTLSYLLVRPSSYGAKIGGLLILTRVYFPGRISLPSHHLGQCPGHLRARTLPVSDGAASSLASCRWHAHPEQCLVRLHTGEAESYEHGS